MCVSTYGPECHLSDLDDAFRGTVTCDKPVILSALADDDITAGIDGPHANYTMQYVVDDTTQYVDGKTTLVWYIQYTVHDSMHGTSQGAHNQEHFYIQFHN